MQNKSNAMSIISMIFGILSLICCCFYGPIGFGLAATGIILGIIVLATKRPGAGMAVAGIVCGIIGLIFSSIGCITLLSSIVNGNVYYNGHQIYGVPQDIPNSIPDPFNSMPEPFNNFNNFNNFDDFVQHFQESL